jgi:peroxiredoxin 2/4
MGTIILDNIRAKKVKIVSMFSTLKIGQPAPNFKLKGAYNNDIKSYDLSDYRGKWIVFFFYPADFTFICPTEVTGFNAALKEFDEKNVQILGCSVDSPHVHIAWAASLGSINYPLLSDVHHTVSMDYNVYDEDEAQSLRGTFIIDPEGNLKWYQISDNNVGRSVQEVLRVIDALQTGEKCPVDWKKGEKTLG